MEIDPKWDLVTAVDRISALLKPGGLHTGIARNQLIEAWASTVGRERALAGLEAIIEEEGSKTAAARRLTMSHGTFKRFQEFFHSLPKKFNDDKPKPGDIYGAWRLDSRLGRGGNAEVWRATPRKPNPNALPPVAVKVLATRKVASDRYARFQDEVAALTSLAGTDGVLPLVDSFAPTCLASGARAWLAMPLAQPIREIVETATVVEILRGCADLAQTLAALHAKGYSHRDLKPDNLFVYDDRWTLGDFGLVTYDGKKTVTRDAQKLGSNHYIPPEMLNAAAGTDGKAADVYSFTKTVWVLVTGNRFPLPGHCPPTGPSCLTEWTGLDLYQLDEVLSAASSLDPTERPSMESLHGALQSASAIVP